MFLFDPTKVWTQKQSTAYLEWQLGPAEELAFVAQIFSGMTTSTIESLPKWWSHTCSLSDISVLLQALSNLKAIRVLANKVNEQVRGGSASSGRPPLSPAGPGYGVVPLAGSVVGHELASRVSDGSVGPSTSGRSSRSSGEYTSLVPMRSMPLPMYVHSLKPYTSKMGSKMGQPLSFSKVIDYLPEYFNRGAGAMQQLYCGQVSL